MSHDPDTHETHIHRKVGCQDFCTEEEPGASQLVYLRFMKKKIQEESQSHAQPIKPSLMCSLWKKIHTVESLGGSKFTQTNQAIDYTTNERHRNDKHTQNHCTDLVYSLSEPLWTTLAFILIKQWIAQVIRVVTTLALSLKIKSVQTFSVNIPLQI